MNPLLIFDFDGTLVDTAPDIVTATDEFFKQMGFAPLSPAEVKENIGQGLTELLMRILPETKTNHAHREELIGRFLAIYKDHYLRTPKLYPGVEEILHEWPHQKAILSNKGVYFIKGILEHLKLASYPWVSVIGGNTFKTKKPEPEGLNHILKTGNVKIEDAVMIGDGNPDAQLAHNTGIFCVALDFGYGEIDELMRLGASVRISHYNELKEVLKRFERSSS